RFIAGKLRYWMDAYPSDVDDYIKADRTAIKQELNLSPRQIDALIVAVEQNRWPENKYYKYDYYIDNCSTRVRDVVDRASDGAVRKQLEAVATPTTFRWHTRRLLADDWIVDLAIQFMLGPYADRPINQWQESFLPVQFMKHLREVKLADGRPLVLSEQTLHTSATYVERHRPPGRVIPYLIIGIVLGAAVC